MEIATISVTRHVAGMSASATNQLPPDFVEAMRPERIGQRLKLLRETLGLRPSQMADSLGIPRTYWSRFENGHRAVTEEVAALLVARHGVTLDFLILGRWDKLPLDLATEMRARSAK